MFAEHNKQEENRCPQKSVWEGIHDGPMDYFNLHSFHAHDSLTNTQLNCSLKPFLQVRVEPIVVFCTKIKVVLEFK